MTALHLPDELGQLKTLAQAAVRPAVRVRVLPFALPTDPTNSRFGGLPFTPPGFVWPEAPAGQALTFIGQINLAEAAEQAPGALAHWPPQGLLQLFYDLEAMPWGFDPQDSRYWRWVWYPNPDEQAAAAPPAGPGSPRRAYALTFHRMDSLPDLERLLEANGLDPEQATALFGKKACELYTDVAGADSPRHQLAGYPWPVQGDPRFDAQFASQGIYVGDASYEADPRTPALLGGLDDWELLWQIDSDDDLGYVWGDLGVLYALIRRADLEKGDLSRPWLVLQSA